MESNTVVSARDSGLFMLLQSCFLILGNQTQTPSISMIDSMKRIVEYSVVQLGVMKELN